VLARGQHFSSVGFPSFKNLNAKKNKKKPPMKRVPRKVAGKPCGRSNLAITNISFET